MKKIQSVKDDPHEVRCTCCTPAPALHDVACPLYTGPVATSNPRIARAVAMSMRGLKELRVIYSKKD